jgi:hypothetical protein
MPFVQLPSTQQLLVEMQVAVPLQKKVPPGQAQTPLWHVLPPLQSALVQQLALGMHAVPHTFWFGGQVQAPPLHE